MKRVVHKIPIETGTGGQQFIKIFFDVYSNYYAMIDTGSDKSFVNSNTYRCKKEDVKKITVSGTSGRMSVDASNEYVTMLTRDVKGNIVETSAQMYAVNDWGMFISLSRRIPEDAEEGTECCMVIGCDMLRDMNANIDFGMNILTLFDGYDNSDE